MQPHIEFNVRRRATTAAGFNDEREMQKNKKKRKIIHRKANNYVGLRLKARPLKQQVQTMAGDLSMNSFAARTSNET